MAIDNRPGMVHVTCGVHLVKGLLFVMEAALRICQNTFTFTLAKFVALNADMDCLSFDLA